MNAPLLRVVINGAPSGIAAATALAFAERGARLPLPPGVLATWAWRRGRCARPDRR